jgi:AAA domain
MADDQQSDPLPVDEPDGSFQFHPWPDLLNRTRRNMIVDRLIPEGGLTTLVGASGEGKTTLAMALALTIDTGAKFLSEAAKPRPVIWVAGEGLEDLRPLYEAWLQSNPSAPPPQGGFIDAPLRFYESDEDTNLLIARIKARPVDCPKPVIFLDALADMMDGGDEDKAKDMNRVYARLWRVIRETGSAVVVIHHTGWEGTRGKGSMAYRAKSDIEVLVKLDQAAMTFNLTCNKTRRGSKWKSIGVSAKSVKVEGFREEILVATGVEVAATSPQAAQAQTKRDKDLDLMMVTLDLDCGGSATRGAWLAKMQEKYGTANWSEDTFDRKRKVLSQEGSITGGGGIRGEPYVLTRNITRKPAPLKGGAGDAGNQCHPQTPATNPQAGNTSTESDGQNQSQMVATEDVRAVLAAEQAKLQAMNETQDGKKS